MARPCVLFDDQRAAVELAHGGLDGCVDAFLVDREALLLQEVEDILLFLLAAALPLVELLSGSDAGLDPLDQP